MVRTQAQIKSIVQQYVRNLETRGIHVRQVVLFGSYAHNRAREGSDIDLAVVAPEFASLNLREIQETLGFANMTLRAPIQALGYSPRRWRYHERGSFVDEIQRTGKVIYTHPRMRLATRATVRQHRTRDAKRA